VNRTIVIITLATLSFQLFVFYRRLSIKSLAHPGFYFAIIWWIAVISQYILFSTDWPFFPYPEFVDELNFYVAFTSFCFILFLILRDRSHVNLNGLTFYFDSNKTYTFLVRVTFIGALLKLIFIWASLGVGFELGAIRIAYTKDKLGVVGGENILYSLISYLNFFYPVVTVLAGYFFGLVIQKRFSPVRSTKLLLLPMVITLIYTISIGGRNPLAIGLKYYLMGFSLSVDIKLIKNTKRKIFRYLLFISVFFIAFTTIISDQRSRIAGQTEFSSTFSSSILKSTSGIMEYMGAHYWGYQLRNNDTFDPNNIGYGYYTFNGLLDIKLPFSQYLGFNIDLGKLMGVKNNVLEYRYLYLNDFIGYYTTRSIYLDMKMDFGYYGTYFFILLFTYYSQYIFDQIHNKATISAIAIIPYFFCFNYWASSNFQSIYAVGVYNYILVFWLYGVMARKFSPQICR
jgi:oligosaccharide repeat unit polymerase